MSAHNSDDDSNQCLEVQDSSENEAEVSVASTRMLALELDSPQDSVDSNRGSTISTLGTDMTPNYTTMSISPEQTSGGSGDTDSKIESIGNTPLDEPNLIEAILERQASADSKVPSEPQPDPEGALNPGALPSGSPGSTGDTRIGASTRDVLPTDVAEDSKRDPGTADAVASGLYLEDEDECSKVPEERALEPKLPLGVPQVPALGDDQLPPVQSVVPQVPVSDDCHLSPVQSSVSQMPVSDDGLLSSAPSDVAQVPVFDDGQLPSIPADATRGLPSAKGAEGSKAGPFDRVDDESCISPSERSHGAETEALEADVSNISVVLERKRKAFRGRKPQLKSPTRLADIVADFFQPHPLVTYVDPDSRADTLDDAEALRLDSVSVRSSIPERSASVIFPDDEVSYPTPPDRARRAISLPAAQVERVPRVPHDPRRAISEAPDDSRLESELPPLSASPDDVPLPSPLVSSSSSSSSRHVSDVDLNACGREGSEKKVSPLDPVSSSLDPVSDPSLESREVEAIMAVSKDLKRDDLPVDSQTSDTSASESSARSSDVAQLQGLQGWMNMGGYQDDRHVTCKGRAAAAESDSSVTRSFEVAQLQALQGWVNQGRDQGERQSGPPKVPNIPQETERVRAVVLSDSSTTRSSEEAQFQALKGWVSYGRGQGDKHLTIENQPSGVIAVSNIPEAERHETSLPNVPERDARVDVRSFAEVKKFDEWIARGGSAEGRASTSVRQPDSSVVVKESREAVEKGVQTESGTGLPMEGGTMTSSVPQPRFPESVKGQPEESKTPKRKRQVKKVPERQPSDEQESTDSSDQLLNVEVSPEEGLATKKYCSEFSRPVVAARRISRSNSTGSVKDEHRHRRNFREWQESSTKESPERENREEEEYSTSKKPKEEDEKDPNA